ncbi:MAG TPA: glycosyltransferase family 2 protein [Burkholderiales bacterium]|nr:glycosyltransferase family 2 protein [Burkholderiales bacterium]
MRVSIITACYNRAATIGEAIESVGAQTHDDIEHIVVDGGSTDGTLEVLERHQASFAKFIRGPDQGLYDALNKGVAAASGEIVGFLHADDVYARNDVIAAVVERMQSQSLDALYGDVAFVRADDVGRVVRVYSSRRFHPSRIAWGWMPAHPALFLRRAVYRHHGGFKTDYRVAADFEFVARIFSTGTLRYAYLPEVLVRMRLGGVSTRGWRSTLTLNREVMRACRENGIATNYLKLLSKYPAKALEFIVRPRAAAQDR